MQYHFNAAEIRLKKVLFDSGVGDMICQDANIQNVKIKVVATCHVETLLEKKYTIIPDVPRPHRSFSTRLVKRARYRVRTRGDQILLRI